MYASSLPAAVRKFSGPPAPDAFEVLASGKLLQKVDSGNANIPGKVGSYPINDPEGLYIGLALAGYGIMWNTRYSKANKLPDPKEWGRPDGARLFRPYGRLLTLALGHHAPYAGNHFAG